MASIPSTEFVEKKVNAFRVKMAVIGRRSFAKIEQILEGLTLSDDGRILQTGNNQTKIEAAVLQLQTDFSRNGNPDLDNAFEVLDAAVPQITNQVKKLYEGKVIIGSKEERSLETGNTITRNELNRIGSNTFIQDSVLDFALNKLLTALRDRVTPGAMIREARDGTQRRIETGLAPFVMATLDQHTRNVSEFLGGLNPLLSWAKYQGPDDEKNRSFCQARVGKDFTIDQVKAWAGLEWSGKIKGTTADNIENHLGGYNCRHVLVYITEDEAKNPGGVITST